MCVCVCVSCACVCVRERKGESVCVCVCVCRGKREISSISHCPFTSSLRVVSAVRVRSAPLTISSLHIQPLHTHLRGDRKKGHKKDSCLLSLLFLLSLFRLFRNVSADHCRPRGVCGGRRLCGARGRPPARRHVARHGESVGGRGRERQAQRRKERKRQEWPTMRGE